MDFKPFTIFLLKIIHCKLFIPPNFIFTKRIVTFDSIRRFSETSMKRLSIKNEPFHLQLCHFEMKDRHNLQASATTTFKLSSLATSPED